MGWGLVQDLPSAQGYPIGLETDGVMLHRTGNLGAGYQMGLLGLLHRCVLCLSLCFDGASASIVAVAVAALAALPGVQNEEDQCRRQPERSSRSASSECGGYCYWEASVLMGAARVLEGGPHGFTSWPSKQLVRAGKMRPVEKGKAD